MNHQIPLNAQWIERGNLAGWLWKTSNGWCLGQANKRLRIVNSAREGAKRHSIDLIIGDLERSVSVMIRSDWGHLDLEQFLLVAQGTFEASNQTTTVFSAQQSHF